MSYSKTILRETARLESLLEANFDATGADFTEKAAAKAGELPKGINEKLAYLGALRKRAEAGERISPQEFKQAKYWIAAVRPYLDYGAARRNRWPGRIVWLILIAGALFAAYRYLR